ncbi:MAG: hypothetical protein NTW86_24225, partial [Candidatus Sumerlaeota bacterium]|nr:hypothetical protein [Candidatus Sumerlaeota bacterium]
MSDFVSHFGAELECQKGNRARQPLEDLLLESFDVDLAKARNAHLRNQGVQGRDWNAPFPGPIVFAGVPVLLHPCFGQRGQTGIVFAYQEFGFSFLRAHGLHQDRNVRSVPESPVQILDAILLWLNAYNFASQLKKHFRPIAHVSAHVKAQIPGAHKLRVEFPAFTLPPNSAGG